LGARCDELFCHSKVPKVRERGRGRLNAPTAAKDTWRIVLIAKNINRRKTLSKETELQRLKKGINKTRRTSRPHLRQEIMSFVEM
jgi:hypothetical protein